MGAILLVRHGQASFGARDYDRLSELGRCQAERVGAALAASGFTPSVIVAGSLRRQEGTAQGILHGAGWSVDPVIDADWNEFDHLGLVSSRSGSAIPTSATEFQAILEQAMLDWVQPDSLASEKFGEFRARTEGALEKVTAGLSSGESALVVSSAGVISWIATALLGGDIHHWIRLNRVMVNASITKLVLGRRGLSLISFNEHGHLAPAEQTYR